ncbi:hypothetical protein R1sor_024405 [Riccia sorocarpa]|uniref:Acid phosphatase n=1 Tax=Riccia sorocarpa TaxID=122646 RepID=A0ABD3GSU9_9MARC
MRSSFLCCCLLLACVVQLSSARQLRQNGRNLVSSSSAWCRGWMTNVESGNIKGFKNTPVQCYSTIRKYMEKGQYLVDLSVSTSEMWNYVSTIKADGVSDAIMFDIDETLISTAQIQAQFKYGTAPFNATYYDSQQDTLILPAMPPSLDLYHKLKAAGWKVILVTGRKEPSRAHTADNLKAVGYSDYDLLILKTDDYTGLTAAVYKSMVRAKLEKENGYKFRSCAGDQYSDCLGEATGERTWKFPNPMYYAA